MTPVTYLHYDGEYLILASKLTPGFPQAKAPGTEKQKHLGG
jgi:hypothetical protein